MDFTAVVFNYLTRRKNIFGRNLHQAEVKAFIISQNQLYGQIYCTALDSNKEVLYLYPQHTSMHVATSTSTHATVYFQVPGLCILNFGRSCQQREPTAWRHQLRQKWLPVDTQLFKTSSEPLQSCDNDKRCRAVCSPGVLVNYEVGRSHVEVTTETSQKRLLPGY